MQSVLADETTSDKRYLPGSSALGISSDGLGWNGFDVLEYRGDRGERPELPQPRYILGLWRKRMATGETADGRGGYVPYSRYPGTVTILPPSIIRNHYAHNSYEVLLCFLNPGFVNRVEEELDHRPIVEPHLRANLDDPPTRQLITLLTAEAAQCAPSGRLYAEHLAHSLAIRLFSLTGASPARASRASALPRHLLGRVLERMHDLNANLDLQSLAAETGYSRSHFLRMFRAATGSTPHHYLLQLRLKRAQHMMKQKRASLIDIAATCGFSSHGHMSRMFRRMLGFSPSDYRRNL